MLQNAAMCVTATVGRPAAAPRSQRNHSNCSGPMRGS